MDNRNEAEQPSPEEWCEKWERERMNRRQVLARFGFKAGAAAIAALTAEELLRKVGQAMAQRAGDNQIAGQVAREFQNAGMAFATSTEISFLAHPPDDLGPGSCVGDIVGRWCKAGHPNESVCRNCCNGVYGPRGSCPNSPADALTNCLIECQ